MRDHLVGLFESHHKIVEAAALQFLLTSPQPLALSRQVLLTADPEAPFVTLEMVERASLRLSVARSGGSLAPIPGVSGPRAPALGYAPIHDGFVEGHTAHAPLEAYAGLFGSRYETLSRFLRGRPDLSNLHPIQEAKGLDGHLAVIGMVREVRQTPEKHHLIVHVEDPTGAMEVIVLKDSPGARVTFLVDEVVGLKLAMPRERGRLARVDTVVRPDVPANRASQHPSENRRVIFLSDLHIGSKSFLTDEWGRLVDFLRGNDERSELAKEIQHVVIAGDLVDGIGIYPGQERDLAIGDIFEQYHELGRRLRELPSHMTLIVLPGNHDAVCPAEPQPALSVDLRKGLPENAHAVGNPSTFALDGVVIEAYHGRSFDDLIPAIPGATYARPTDVMRRMLAMRHLAPIYGGRTPLAALPRDGLLIDPAPDILVTGHSHTFGVDQYRGVVLLNASTWQAETEYQRMRNVSPVPARAAVVNLKDMSVDAFDFSAPGSRTRSALAA